MRSLALKLPPVALFLLVAAGMWLLATHLAFAALAVPYAAASAALFAAVGIAIAVLGVVEFRRHETSVDPTKPDKASALVSTGIFGVSRNPMYLGLALLLVAWGLYLQNALSLAGVPAFVVYLNELQIKPEERALGAAFGAAYEDYCRQVRRWI